MKGRVVILDQIDGRGVAALVFDGVLHDLLLDPPEGAPPGVGAIARARADRPLKGQGGLTLQLGEGLTGYLRRPKDLAPGETVLVQVAGMAEPGKAIPVTPDLIFKSRYCIVTPFAPGQNISRAIRDDAERDRLLEIAHGSGAAGRGFGLILRSAASGVAQDVLQDDIEVMCRTAAQILEDGAGPPQWLLDAEGAHALAWRDWADPDPDEVIEEANAFATHGVLEAVDTLLSSHHALPGGAHAYIEVTRALIAVDINTGKDHSLAAGLKANLALVRDLPRLLRVKGLGGQITLDLAPMPKRDRKQVEDAIKKAFRRDGADIVVAGWTPLGHLELTRKRDRLPLAQAWPRPRQG